ncbi:MAG: hypothetical protein ACPHDT_15160 [Acidimicrobiales bacterium]
MEPVRLDDLDLAELRSLAYHYGGPTGSYDRAAILDYLHDHFNNDVACGVCRRPDRHC